MPLIAVAATGAQALDAGLLVGRSGGNAVDAALAAALVAMATEPGMVSLGGGCYIAVWPAGGDPVVIDGNVEMPGRDGDPERRGHGLRVTRSLVQVSGGRLRVRTERQGTVAALEQPLAAAGNARSPLRR